jgi:SRSO17 transposase
MDAVARQVQATLAAEMGGAGLLVNECGWKKAGTKGVGVDQQYIGQVGGQLFLLAAWCADVARYAQAHIPLAARPYPTKPELAVALVKHLLGLGVVRADWMGGNAAYGNSLALRQALQRQGQVYVLDVGPGLQLYPADPTPAGAPVWSG